MAGTCTITASDFPQRGQRGLDVGGGDLAVGDGADATRT